MTSGLQKAFDLSKKTGDKLIVFDSSRPDNTFVVMPIDEYEKMMIKRDVKGLTEGELIDKINGDIALWKNMQEEVQNDRFATNDFGQHRPENSQGNQQNYQQIDSKKRWGIPQTRKEAATEIVSEESSIKPEISF